MAYRSNLCALAALVVAGCSLLAHGQDILLSPEADAARRYPFTAEDNLLLDEIQRGCFNYLWNEVGDPAKLVRDRTHTEVSSVAAVGFQLSALPIGVERGWVSREEAEQRALAILRALVKEQDNKKFGIYLHFVDRQNAKLVTDAPEVQTSTVDHAILQSGAIPAGIYFGGEVRELVDKLIADANWKAYARPDDQLLSFGWRSSKLDTLDADGELRPWVWHVTGAEETLCYMHAVASPKDDHKLDPTVAYKMKRKLGQHSNMLPYVVTWNGAMFTYFFDQCWIDYRRYEADDPSEFGGQGPRVNWFENTRRAFAAHRQRCIEKSPELISLGQNRWGIGPCIGLNEVQQVGYLVQELLPNHSGMDQWQGGTVAPYVTASALPFMPAETLAALREMKELKNANGYPLVWRSPAEGGYGFLDSFNLEHMHAPDEYVGIDVGPMLLLIENARTGLIWNLFHQHPNTRRAVERLGWVER
jgi:hypothetical protein